MKPFIALFLIFLSVPLSLRASQVDRRWATLKASKLLGQNLSHRRVRTKRSPSMTLTDENLYLSILEILREEQAFGFLAVQALKVLILRAGDLPQIWRDEVVQTIETLEMSEANKEELKVYLENGDVDYLDTHSDLPLRSKIPIRQTIHEVKDLVTAAKFPASVKHTVAGSLDVVENLLVGEIPANHCYHTDPGCQFMKNLGLIFYNSRRVLRDHRLALTLLRLSIRIQHLNHNRSELLEATPFFDSKFDIDIWPLALASAERDPLLALEALTIYGHDVINNNLVNATNEGPRFLIDVLNKFNPSSGDDAKPESLFVYPGALRGIVPKPSIVRQVRRALEDYARAHGTAVETLRNGYYHVYGGVLIAQALLARGYGKIGPVNYAALVSQALGYAYKRTQLQRYLTDDAEFLWASMGENEFAISRKPKGWTEDRFNRAHTHLRLHLAFMEYTEEQHRIGARFAMEVYQGKFVD